MSFQPSLRLLSSATPSLGQFYRVGRNDHRSILEAIAEGRLGVSGLVIDAALVDRHLALLQEAHHVGITRILDPRSLELATEGGFLMGGVAGLPWAGAKPDTVESFSRARVHAVADDIAEFAIRLAFDAVLAPTHYLEDVTSPWLAVDNQLVKALRAALDSRGGHDIAIYYPLGIPTSVLRDSTQRGVVITRVRGLPIDGLWLRIHPFAASTAGPIVLRRYIDGARAMLDLGLPIVAEHTGGAGLALLAFSAVGGIEGGITRGERFDYTALAHQRDGDPWSPAPRVYVAALGLYLSRNQAVELAAKKGAKAALACKDLSCCPRGFDDMIRQPVRHFLIQRQREVKELAAVPPSLRAKHFVDEVLRRSVDTAARVTRLDPSLEKLHSRLDARRRALESLLREEPLPRVEPLVPIPGRLAPPRRPHSI